MACSFVGFGPPYVLPLRYLWIFETEMAHVVVDETEGKTSVHEGQAPLGREREREREIEREREREQRYTCNSTLAKLMMLLSTARPKYRFSDWFFQKCWFIKQNPNKCIHASACNVECCGKSSKGRTTFARRRALGEETAIQTLMKLARLRLMLRASSGISMWRMVMCGMIDSVKDWSAWWKLSGKRWVRGIWADRFDCKE